MIEISVLKCFNICEQRAVTRVSEFFISGFKKKEISGIRIQIPMERSSTMLLALITINL